MRILEIFGVIGVLEQNSKRPLDPMRPCNSLATAVLQQTAGIPS